MPAPLTTTFLAYGAILILGGLTVLGLVAAALAAMFEVALFLLSGSDRGLG